MTAIASYYASVGVGIDPKSLQNVQRYLDTIQAKMVKFQKDSTSFNSVPIKLSNFSVNQASLRKALTTAINTTSDGKVGGIILSKFNVSRSAIRSAVNSAINTTSTGEAAPGIKLSRFVVSRTAIRSAIASAIHTTSTGKESAGIALSKFSVSRKELLSSINGILNNKDKPGGIRIGAILSQASLAGMKKQIRESINQLVVNPTINPRVRVQRTGVGTGQGTAGSGGSGSRPNRFTTRDPRSMNPWHNPMMIGGSAGAFMRYGMFSLPFVAGAYGLNSLSQNMTRLEGHNIMLTTSTQSPVVAREQFDVVDRISAGLGLRTSDILPFYAQMFAGARGTTLEQELPASFQGFMEYAMAMGVNDQQLEGGIRAISQAISKGAIYSEEWRQQLTCVVIIMLSCCKTYLIAGNS